MNSQNSSPFTPLSGKFFSKISLILFVVRNLVMASLHTKTEHNRGFQNSAVELAKLITNMFAI